MKRKLLGAIGTALVVGAMAPTTQAAPLSDRLVNGVFNAFSDASREAVFNTDTSTFDFGGTIGVAQYVSVGDVFAGFFNIDNQDAPGAGSSIPDGDLVAVFAIEVASVSATTLTWKGSTVAGFTLADFIPGAGPLPGLGGETAAAALFSMTGVDPIAQLPLDGNLPDSLNRIATDGTLELIAGLAAGSDDFFAGSVGGLIPLSLIPSISASTPVSTFGAGLTVLANLTGVGLSEDACAGDAVPGGIQPPLLPANCVTPLFGDPTVAPGTLHDIVISAGSLRGTAGGTIGAPTISALFGTHSGVDYFGFTNRAGFTVAPFGIPAPGPLALLGAGLVLLGLRRRS